MNMLSAGTPPAEPILTCTVCELLNILEGKTEEEEEEKQGEIWTHRQSRIKILCRCCTAHIVFFFFHPYALQLLPVSQCVSEAWASFFSLRISPLYWLPAHVPTAVVKTHTHSLTHTQSLVPRIAVLPHNWQCETPAPLQIPGHQCFPATRESLLSWTYTDLLPQL